MQLSREYFLVRRFEIEGHATHIEQLNLTPDFTPATTVYYATSSQDRIMVKVEMWDPDVDMYAYMHISGCNNEVDHTYKITTQFPDTIVDEVGKPIHM